MGLLSRNWRYRGWPSIPRREGLYDFIERRTSSLENALNSSSINMNAPLVFELTRFCCPLSLISYYTFTINAAQFVDHRAGGSIYSGKHFAAVQFGKLRSTRVIDSSRGTIPRRVEQREIQTRIVVIERRWRYTVEYATTFRHRFNCVHSNGSHSPSIASSMAECRDLLVQPLDQSINETRTFPARCGPQR